MEPDLSGVQCSWVLAGLWRLAGTVVHIYCICTVLQRHRVINAILREACFVPGFMMWYRVGCGQTYLASNVHEYLLDRGTLLAQ